MNCEANGCTAALTPKAIPGSAADVAAGIPSPWVVTDIPPGWCVRQVENTDVGSSRVVVLCRLHGAGIVKPEDALLTGAEFLAVADAAELTGDLDELDVDDGPWADPRLEAARLRSVIEEGAASSSRLAAEVARVRAECEKRGRELAACWRALESSDQNKSAIAAKVTWRGSATDFITDLLAVLVDEIQRLEAQP